MVESFAGLPRRGAWGVAALVREVAELIGARLGACAVRGEISGFTRASSGHCYFTLKDADGATALIRCAMFRRSAGLLDFNPAEGQLVEVRGRIGVYEPRGELQLIVEAMQRAGEGALYEQFLRIKARLEAEGLFDAARKRALSAFPATIGVVTSLDAAALRDVLAAFARRTPHLRVIVYPSPVQGSEAPQRLVEAIARASARAEVDALIVCRGGGSLEDLWAFNDEGVVRAICAAPMPVVSGVGHETDVTLADFAADVRAPTPTAAAELVAPTRATCLEALDGRATLLRRRVSERLDLQAQRLDRAALRLSRPGQALRSQRERLALLSHRLAGHPGRATELQRARLTALALALRQSGRGIESRRARLDAWTLSLHQRAAQHVATQQHRLHALALRLDALDPHQVLARGYAWLSDSAGHAVTSTQQLQVGQALNAVLHDGSAELTITGVQRGTSG